MVASFTDAWIETQREATDVITQKSHLLQMRGLKLFVGGYADQANLSHLLQMRGLKQNFLHFSTDEQKVASFTDAWIETYKR